MCYSLCLVLGVQEWKTEIWPLERPRVLPSLLLLEEILVPRKAVGGAQQSGRQAWVGHAGVQLG